MSSLIAGLELDQWIRLKEVPSTNDYLMNSSLPAGSVVTAENQSRGKGRSGRLWRQSPARGLYFSGAMGWKDQPPGPLFSLAMGLAVHESIMTIAVNNPHIRLKWPNDLVRWTDTHGENPARRLVRPEKLGGILIEGKAHSEGWMTVIGIGINWMGAPEAADEDAFVPGALFPLQQDHSVPSTQSTDSTSGANSTSEMEERPSRSAGSADNHASTISPDISSTVPSIDDFVPVLIRSLNHHARIYDHWDTIQRFKRLDILQGRNIRIEGRKAQVQDLDSRGSLVLDTGEILTDSARSIQIL